MLAHAAIAGVDEVYRVGGAQAIGALAYGTASIQPSFIGYGHMCNAFEVPDPEGGFYELKDVPHGNVLIENYFATSINACAAVWASV